MEMYFMRLFFRSKFAVPSYAYFYHPHTSPFLNIGAIRILNLEAILFIMLTCWIMPSPIQRAIYPTLLRKKSKKLTDFL